MLPAAYSDVASLDIRRGSVLCLPYNELVTAGTEGREITFSWPRDCTVVAMLPGVAGPQAYVSSVYMRLVDQHQDEFVTDGNKPDWTNIQTMCGRPGIGRGNKWWSSRMRVKTHDKWVIQMAVNPIVGTPVVPCYLLLRLGDAIPEGQP